MSRVNKKSVVLLVLIAIPACAHVDPQPDLERTQQLIDQTTGMAVEYDLDNSEALTGPELDELLADGLTLSDVLRLGLTHNRRLQVEFLRIGVAKADWVQSKLWTNPSLNFLIAFPSGGGTSNIQAGLTQNILDLWRIPIRKRIARHRLDQAVYQIARLAGEQVAALKQAYFEAVAAGEILNQARQHRALLEQSHNAITARKDLGTATALDVSLARDQLLRVELELRNARLDMATAKRRLAQLLSLPPGRPDFTLTDALAESTTLTFSPERLTELALGSRLDLKSRSVAVLAAEENLARERRKWLGNASAGAYLERPETGSDVDLLLGPTLSLTLPIFDQNQAQVARAHYLYLQQLRLQEDLSNRIGHDIAVAVDRANTALEDLGFYRDQLLPQAQKSFDFANDSFSEGQTDILILLKAQERLLDIQRAYVSAQLRATITLLDLEKTVGVPLNELNQQGQEPK